MNFVKSLFTILLIINSTISAQEANVLRTYAVPSSRQAVATDASFLYVINNSSITKHQKDNGNEVSSWHDTDSIIHHLNSGIIIDQKLYCCNSNYPESPMASSIEIFDPNTLQHIANHSFGIGNGSATWLAKHNDFWYVTFAHYTGRASEMGKDNSWTRIVKFDNEWRAIESWIFPKALIKEFGGKSNSGGVILEDGTLLCTGHDNYELYVLKFPSKGYTLEWVNTIPVGSFGQGISYESLNGKKLIYGIVKKDNMVVVSDISL